MNYIPFVMVGMINPSVVNSARTVVWNARSKVIPPGPIPVRALSQLFAPGKMPCMWSWCALSGLHLTVSACLLGMGMKQGSDPIMCLSLFWRWLMIEAAFLVFSVNGTPRGNCSGCLAVSGALKSMTMLPRMYFCSTETSATLDATFEDVPT